VTTWVVGCPDCDRDCGEFASEVEADRVVHGSFCLNCGLFPLSKVMVTAGGDGGVEKPSPKPKP